MRSSRRAFHPLALLSFGGVSLLAYACGGTDGNNLFDGGPDGEGLDVSLVDNTVPPDDTGVETGNDSGDAADAPIDTGPLCLQTTCIVGLAVGGYHACGLVNDGTVRCWGRNNTGQLGVGLPADGGPFDPTAQPTPVKPPLTGISQITASHHSITLSSTCVLGPSGAQCFGSNSYGQLGLSADAGAFDNNPHPTPTTVQGLPTSLLGVWAGNIHSCAVAQTGDTYCWGDNQGLESGRTATGQIVPVGIVTSDAGPAIAVSPGYEFSIGLLKNGNVLSWGTNSANDLGRTPLVDPDLAAPITTLSNVTNISAGLQHACAVSNGALYCWGDNTNGEIGNGSAGGQIATPTQINVGSKTILQVTTGYSTTCALASDHTVYCWGQNDWGQTGAGQSDAGFNNADVPSPTQVQGLTGSVLQVEAGTNHGCVRINGGSVMCWGANDRGQLGQGAVDNNPHPKPVLVTFL